MWGKVCRMCLTALEAPSSTAVQSIPGSVHFLSGSGNVFHVSRLARRQQRCLSSEIEAISRRKKRDIQYGRRGRPKPRPKTLYPVPGEDDLIPSETDGLDTHVTGMETGMAVTWLGTSSGAPTKHRNVSSIAVQWPGRTFLFDAGEGTQVQILKGDIFPAHITRIFITHLHGDHCFGLPGLLNTISKVRTYHMRGEMLHIYGPPGLEELLRMSLPFWYGRFRMPITVTEFTFDAKFAHEPKQVDKNGNVFVARMAPTSAEANTDTARQPRRSKSMGLRLAEGLVKGYQWEIPCGDGVTVTAGQLQHRVPCWGYVVKEDDYVPERWERELTQKKMLIKGLESSIDVDADNLIIPGRKVVILGDTCNSSALTKIAQNADLLSHEATFAGGMEDKAHIAQHSTAFMAGQFAKKINAKQLILTHFSARYGVAGKDEHHITMADIVQEAKRGFASSDVRAASDFSTYDVPKNENLVADDSVTSGLDATALA